MHQQIYTFFFASDVKIPGSFYHLYRTTMACYGVLHVVIIIINITHVFCVAKYHQLTSLQSEVCPSKMFCFQLNTAAALSAEVGKKGEKRLIEQ